ncbi:hypothetical protein KP509_10G021000 [Ceratopteris richardii]|uniref:Uncharacterized protein n=1 Tax=Ceratopteris richardii TaxID=49495 RepID=A0A8T2TZC2_CERRI|nr:hypothetical protein KP509_10G021000 [Ceratopteris richardii]
MDFCSSCISESTCLAFKILVAAWTLYLLSGVGEDCIIGEGSFSVPHFYLLLPFFPTLTFLSIFSHKGPRYPHLILLCHHPADTRALQSQHEKPHQWFPSCLLTSFQKTLKHSTKRVSKTSFKKGF